MEGSKLIVFSARGADTFSNSQRKLLKRTSEVLFVKATEQIPSGKLIKIARSADYLALTPRATNSSFPNIIDQMPNLKGLIIPTTGFDWLDVRTLQMKGLLISHVPDFCSDSAAEFTMGLLVNLVRHISTASLALKTGGMANGTFWGMELRGKTIGIVGLGKIGGRVANFASSFKMNVLATDVDKSLRGAPFVKLLPLKKLLQLSDIVSLHLPLNKSTIGIMNAKNFMGMKRGSWLINTSRPSLVEMKALLKALNTGRLSGYALDTGYSSAREMKPLLSHPRILAVPHISWYTREAIQAEIAGWVDEMVSMVRGKPRSLIPPLQ